MDGIEATRQIVDSTDAMVVILTTFDLDQYVYGALRSGASGFLVKDTPPVDLLAAVRTVAAGDALLSPSVTRRLIARFVEGGTNHRVTPGSTSPTQSPAAKGKCLPSWLPGRPTTRSPSSCTSPIGTAKTHVARLLAELEARDRVQLVIRAHGLEGDPDQPSPD